MTARLYDRLDSLLRRALPLPLGAMEWRTMPRFEGLLDTLSYHRGMFSGGATGKSMLAFNYAALEQRLAADRPELLVLDSYSDLVPSGNPLEPYRAPRDYGIQTTLSAETLELAR